MNIAILGGGITGLTAAYYLQKKGHTVTVFEKNIDFGGLASGFKQKGWKWSLERAYHHLFSNDKEILEFCQEIDFKDIFFSTPKTDSLYKKGNNYSMVSVDTPFELLRFPYLGFFEKLRLGIMILFLKITPMMPVFEQITSKEFIIKYMGKNAWSVFFKDLFIKKFGKHTSTIVASFIWARIHKRTKRLGYIKGGFQSFVDYLVKLNKNNKTQLLNNIKLTSMSKIKNRNKYKIIYKHDNKTTHSYFDVVISTLPTPVLIKLAKKTLPNNYLNGLSKIKYLHALVLIIESTKKILNQSYWLNICTPSFPTMLIAQHTNFINPRNYNNHEIAYIGYYLEKDNPLMKLREDALVQKIMPHIVKINPKFTNKDIVKTHVFKGWYGQPLYTRDFLKYKPSFITSEENFYIANLDMCYPFDRGVNYAVSLGKKVASIVGL